MTDKTMQVAILMEHLFPSDLISDCLVEQML